MHDQIVEEKEGYLKNGNTACCTSTPKERKKKKGKKYNNLSTHMKIPPIPTAPSGVYVRAGLYLQIERKQQKQKLIKHTNNIRT